jgi:hypothetical protein
LSLAIDEFRTAAKLTQTMYGMRRKAAGLEIRKKVTIVRAIAIQRTVISTNA